MTKEQKIQAASEQMQLRTVDILELHARRIGRKPRPHASLVPLLARLQADLAVLGAEMSERGAAIDAEGDDPPDGNTRH